jgi:GT2 family glycosyltransferase
MTAQPELSVVVPTHNRRELIGRCIDALSAQTVGPERFEAVIADDGSTDGTGEMLAGLKTRFALTTLRIGRVGQSAARNAGIDAARGEICLLLDDDVIPAPGLVAEHLAAHRGSERRIGIGSLSQTPPANGDWYARAFARGWAAHYRRLEKRAATWADCYGGNISVPRAALLEIGGFATDVAVGEDIELGFRLCEVGCVPTYVPGAHAVHDDQKPRRRLLRDVRLHGAVYLDLSKRHPEMFPKLLGWFGDAERRELALRRVLIALRVPPSLLAEPGRLLSGEDRQDRWYEFVWKLAFWRSVRGNVARAEWSALTATKAPPALSPPDEATS